MGTMKQVLRDPVWSKRSQSERQAHLHRDHERDVVLVEQPGLHCRDHQRTGNGCGSFGREGAGDSRSLGGGFNRRYLLAANKAQQRATKLPVKGNYIHDSDKERSEKP